ncbi:hypothetical protein CDCA_CDCA08G2338 [Cyanidium caldarium]|uniref:Coenzyme Q-binding protein COQ10 START domain-containing protein n=1 Tax=Cyanidium caldarium TaxID=2771 RepID=A0AAV9IWY2_CYACA|nr:hypothetical protein CDCA_CDCA08G2338 [Cyanidium caldarium]
MWSGHGVRLLAESARRLPRAGTLATANATRDYRVAVAPSERRALVGSGAPPLERCALRCRPTAPAALSGVAWPPCSASNELAALALCADRSLHTTAPVPTSSLATGATSDKSSLSRSFREHRLLPFAAQELYHVVADVDRYCEFVPWCTSSRVVQRHGERLMEAELGVGFRWFHERYLSLVRLNPGHSVKATASKSQLFEHLVNEWHFQPGPEPDTAWVLFSVDFRFRSPLYRAAVDLFFNEVAKRMVSAFEARAAVLAAEREPGMPS